VFILILLVIGDTFTMTSQIYYCNSSWWSRKYSLFQYSGSIFL